MNSIKLGVLPALLFLSACVPQTQDSEKSKNVLVKNQKSMEDCGIDNAEYNRLLNLSQNEFDQDFNGGWRVYAEKDGCDNATAELIKDYILYSRPSPPERHGILRWHAGQVLAGYGQYEQAIRFFRGTYKDLEDHGETWNLYVDATIGFLENDRDKIQSAYDTLSTFEVPEEVKEARRQFLRDNPNVSMPEGFVDEPQNLSVVKRLLNCFGKPYSEAYGDCEKD